MHEMAICESILQIVEEQATEHKYDRVKMICLEVGQFSGVELEALRFSFDVVTRGSCAENAKLEIVETRAEVWCLPCAKNVLVEKRFDTCPNCGSGQLQITGGDELRIKELEVN